MGGKARRSEPGQIQLAASRSILAWPVARQNPEEGLGVARLKPWSGWCRPVKGVERESSAPTRGVISLAHEMMSLSTSLASRAVFVAFLNKLAG